MTVTANNSAPFPPLPIRTNPDLIDDDEEGADNDNTMMNGGGGSVSGSINSAGAASASAAAAVGFDASMSVISHGSGNSNSNGNNHNSQNKVNNMNNMFSITPSSRMSLSSSALRASNGSIRSRRGGGPSPANANFNSNNAVLPLSYYNSTSSISSNTNNGSNINNSGNHNPSSFLITNPGAAAAAATYTIKSMDSIKGHLLSLEDEHSTYMNVARACHFFNQFATHGSYNSTPASTAPCSYSSSSQNSDSNSSQYPYPYSSYSTTPKVIQSSTIHIAQYTQHMTKILSSLSITSTTHADRRCRILAIQSLSTIALQSLTKMLFSPSLYANRENEMCVHRLQDEICNDVMVTLVHCVLGDTVPDGDGIGIGISGGSSSSMGMSGGLMTGGRNSTAYYEADDDDGVSAIALECIGKIVCTNDGGLNYDQLVKEVLFLTGKQPMVKSTHLVPRRGLWDYGSGSKSGNRHGSNNHAHRSYANYVQDIDINYTTYKSDLQWRILESILAPRARKLFIRACLYKCTEHVLRSLNALNDIMIFVYKTERARRGVDLGKDGFAKRWYEFDASMLVQEYVELLLIPLLRKLETVDGTVETFCGRRESSSSSSSSSCCCEDSLDMTMCVVMNSLVLCSVVTCKEVWSDQLIQLSVQNLERALQRLVRGQSNLSHATTGSSAIMEMKKNLMAASLVAVRGIPRNERLKTLLTVAEIITMMPSTNTVPGGSISPALPLGGEQQQQRRKPSRVGYWTEIALAILLPDGFSTSTSTYAINKTTATSTTKRKKSLCGEGATSTAVNYFLSSNFAQSLFHSRSKIWKKSVINPAEEMVYVFCSVSYVIGKRISSQIVATENSRTVSNDSSHVIIQVNSESSMPENGGGSWIQMEYKSWFRASLGLLNTFLPCLSWEPVLLPSSNAKRSSKELVRSTTFCCASQRSYIELLKVLLIASGILSTTSSVFLHFMCSIPKTILDEESTENFRLSSQSNITTENDLKLLLDNLLKLLVNRNDISRKVKISLLTLLSDTWTQRCKVMISASAGLQLDQKEIAGPVDIDEDVVNINEQQARELLSLLATEISRLLAEEKKRNISPEDSVEAGEAMRYLMACVASVESMGYTAQLLANHFSESKTNTENEESAKHIVSVCTVVLKGQGKIEVEPEAKEDVSTESESTASNSNSPPRSLNSRARITAFTLECADAAKRLQNFVGYYDDVYDLGDNQHTIDFNCLCPLFKRPNFGLSSEDHCFTNDIWNLADSFSLIHINDGFDNGTYGKSRTPTTKASLLQMRHHFKGDVYQFAHQLQLYRQLLCHQVDQAIDSSPLYFLRHPEPDVQSSGFSMNPSLRMSDPLRLSVPPKSNERLSSGQLIEETDWSNNTFMTSSASDPLATALSYSVRQCSRFDGDVEWGLVVTVVVHNVTAVPISSGVRVDATIFLNDSESEIPKSSGLCNQGHTETSLYKNELAPGDHFIWEFILDSWLMGGQISVKCAIRELETESSRNELLNFHGNQDEVEEDSVDDRNGDLCGDEEGEETLDVVFTGRPVSFSPMIVLQPSPLVFYRDRCGDPVIFQFLWISMQHCLSEIRLVPTGAHDSAEKKEIFSHVCNDNTFRELAISSNMDIPCLDDCGEPKNMTVWSFSTWCGKHILVATDVDVNKSSQMTLHTRGNDLDLLRYFVLSQKEVFIAGLTGGRWCETF